MWDLRSVTLKYGNMCNWNPPCVRHLLCAFFGKMKRQAISIKITYLLWRRRRDSRRARKEPSPGIPGGIMPGNLRFESPASSSKCKQLSPDGESCLHLAKDPDFNTVTPFRKSGVSGLARVGSEEEHGVKNDVKTGETVIKFYIGSMLISKRAN